MSEDKLNDLIAQTPKTLTPAKDLWPDIEARLDVVDNAPQQGAWPKLMIACSITLLAVIGLLNWQGLNINNNQDSTLIMLAQIHAQHLQQIEQLQQATATQTVALRAGDQQLKSALDPHSPWFGAIEELRQAAQLLYQALKNDPHDKQLLQLWLWTHSREIELLQQSQEQYLNGKIDLTPKPTNHI